MSHNFCWSYLARYHSVVPECVKRSDLGMDNLTYFTLSDGDYRARKGKLYKMTKEIYFLIRLLMSKISAVEIPPSHHRGH